jgi:glycosyltransferase involved in cell wall biosynthesis
VKVALVHDFLNQSGGAERVLACLHQMFPAAPIFTTIAERRDLLWPGLQNADIRVSWMQRLPGVLRHHRIYLPLYPHAIESLPLREFDLVISSSSAFAKGALTRSDALHICYCHNPMRFVWEYDRYVRQERFGRFVRAALPVVIRRLRAWDLRAAQRPSLWIANSSVVAERIRRYYGLPSTIVFPPVDVLRYGPSTRDEDYYLIVTRLLAYKRIDLAVQAFNRSGRPLIVAGDGPDRVALEAGARSNIQFTGRLPDAEIASLYARCRAVILPGEEDFGIVPLEANAAGRPVVAFRAGGALDTVIENRTGVFFREQTAEALCDAVAACEGIEWDKPALRRHAEGFGEPVFRDRFRAVLNQALAASGGPTVPTEVPL